MNRVFFSRKHCYFAFYFASKTSLQFLLSFSLKYKSTCSLEMSTIVQNMYVRYNSQSLYVHFKNVVVIVYSLLFIFFFLWNNIYTLFTKLTTGQIYHTCCCCVCCFPWQFSPRISVDHKVYYDFKMKLKKPSSSWSLYRTYIYTMFIQIYTDITFTLWNARAKTNKINA